MILLENPILFILMILLTVISGAAIAFSIVSFSKYDDLRKRLDIFMSGKDGETLEDFFIDLQNNVDLLSDQVFKFRDNIKKLNRITKHSLQKCGFYRYDAFEEKTGKRSFALALLDFTNTGFVVTCQNLGDSTIIFIKDVDAGATNVKLGPEEEKALEIAMGQRDKYDPNER